MASYPEGRPKVVPMSHEELMLSLGQVSIHTLVKTHQPSPQELKVMLDLAEELPGELC